MVGYNDCMRISVQTLIAVNIESGLREWFVIRSELNPFYFYFSDKSVNKNWCVNVVVVVWTDIKFYGKQFIPSIKPGQ